MCYGERSLLSVLSWHLHTDDRAFRSGKSTKQNAHKRVLALDIQITDEHHFGFNEKKKKLYKGGLESRNLRNT